MAPVSRLLVAVAWLGGAASLAGCVGALELGRAETLPRGRWEVGAAAGVSALVEPRKLPPGEAKGGTLFLVPLLPFDASLAYGATDRIELGARVGTLSAQLGLKGLLLRSPVLALAVAGWLSADVYGRELDVSAVRSRLALIAGRRLGEHFELDLAPQCSWPLDPARWKPELLGATATFYVRPDPARGTRIGLAVSWQHYAAPHPGPGDVSAADYVGGALVFSRGPDEAAPAAP
jgi:hypothetical protein